ncbi:MULTISPECIES: c-type cytochrome [Pseudomonas]|uniref:Cytochrome c4 n=2 Tax=Pseudomonas chlororaphis TaxID=587753 RepID=A0AAD0ZJI3_9PSED|nr:MULTISPECIES: c-type cytochrome [Pseudomonas]AZD92963.1 Cytochrome c4 [Pseudomonas chlororaphis subsp. aureofaciens]AZD99410.1 Cytochrome c4 [Pseudomonas chlororaphis subsp. aureofaciens]AZE05594.1 Cytochrome c4 [Pseudomonas chlororaphis subsp. aureofaciens]AZE11791.1 Cytochrome c4 [Pseudomonas chlororaphis subsp. aureofaciens]AZE30269.1 Cytochrome c4 [Pseudomonas chlororaphis subsp. aureofaciens]
MIPMDRILLSSLMLFFVASAQAVDGQKVFTQGGAQPGATACLACHGGDGLGLAAAGFPRLAGLSAGYLRKQLEDFRSGARSNPVMQPLAKALSDDEIDAVSQTLAAMPAVTPAPINRSAMAEGVGARLALRGAWERQVPECVICHGPGGVGVGDAFPPLAGQPAAYLVGQLNAWRDGTRRNDPNDLMGHIAKALSPEEITAVADYFAKVGSLSAKADNQEPKP